MLENLSAWHLGVLLLLAVLVFGDKLPNVIADGLRMLRQLRRMASSATADLNRELGTDIKPTDLHPKALVRKYVLSEDDEAALRRPLQTLTNDLRGLGDELRRDSANINLGTAQRSGPVVAGSMPDTDPVRATARRAARQGTYNIEAT